MARQAKPWDVEDEKTREILVEHVDASDLSEREVARRAGITQGRLRSILAGDRAPATLGEIVRIAGVFGMRGSAVLSAAEGRAAEAAPREHRLASGLPVIKDDPELLKGPAIVTPQDERQRAVAELLRQRGSRSSQPAE